MITIRFRTDEEREILDRAIADGSLMAALGVPVELEQVSVGPGGSAGVTVSGNQGGNGGGCPGYGGGGDGSPWLTISRGGTGASVTRNAGSSTVSGYAATSP